MEDQWRRTFIKLKGLVHHGLGYLWARRAQLTMLAMIISMFFVSDVSAQEARVRSFFTRARDMLVFAGPLITIGCLFWGGSNVMRERPAGKQWAGAAIFLALTVLSGMLQDWWR